MGDRQYAKVNNMIELENIEIEVVTDPKEIYGKQMNQKVLSLILTQRQSKHMKVRCEKQ